MIIFACRIDSFHRKTPRHKVLLQSNQLWMFNRYNLNAELRRFGVFLRNSESPRLNFFMALRAVFAGRILYAFVPSCKRDVAVIAGDFKRDKR